MLRRVIPIQPQPTGDILFYFYLFFFFGADKKKEK